MSDELNLRHFQHGRILCGRCETLETRPTAVPGYALEFYCTQCEKGSGGLVKELREEADRFDSACSDDYPDSSELLRKAAAEIERLQHDLTKALQNHSADLAAAVAADEIERLRHSIDNLKHISAEASGDRDMWRARALELGFVEKGKAVAEVAPNEPGIRVLDIYRVGGPKVRVE